MKLYLAHPRAVRSSVKEWQKEFTIRTGIELINPFYDINREDIEKLDRGEEVVLDFERIVNDDLNAIEYDSDGVLAYIPDIKNICGTFMEMAYTQALFYLPVYVIAEGEYWQKHPWIKYHAQEIFTSVQDCINRINN